MKIIHCPVIGSRPLTEFTVVGVLAAAQATIALGILVGDESVAGVLWNYRGLDGRLRAGRVGGRSNCPLCTGQINDMDERRYLPPECAA